MQNPNQLEDMIGTLLQVDDQAWGAYAFSRDVLKRRIRPEQIAKMTDEAICCGKNYAKRMIAHYGCKDVRLLAEKMKIKVQFEPSSITGNRILFACYTPPDHIAIMDEPIRRAALLVSQEAPGLVELFRQDDIMNTILGHEIFHAVEDRYESEMYTRTEKIVLWHFLGLKNCSKVRALSEIAAMSFTRELNRLDYSPFILDFLLYFSYDSSGAESIYRDVLGVGSGRCREAVEDHE
ncbi:hypothetical protein J41TS12_12540 [Paenibacillus antibioticophila]|uniref:Uncharacterized protein n=1 Tax=Paenibacillus antibioticophila TaxID=1274374 RepID=A0A919XU26_9BACL|nr:hypothetical protein [Paenibacillus antibioticophila]GIO36393.1 hypothetical protein J41TS12_12540 [Paenibacillus antibioticophila]